MQRYVYKTNFKVLCLLTFAIIEFHSLLGGNFQAVSGTDTTARYYTRLSMQYLDSSGNRCFEYAGKAIEYAHRERNSQSMADAYNANALAFQLNGQYREALALFDSVIVYAEAANDIFRLNTTYNNIGVILRKQGAFEPAITNFEKSLNYARKCNDSISIAYCLSNIGSCHAAQNSHTLALIFYSRAVGLFNQLPDTRVNIAHIENNVAGVLGRQKKYESAVYHYNKAYEVFDSLKNNAFCVKILGFTAEALLADGQPEKAKTYIEKGQKLISVVEDPDIVGGFYYAAYRTYSELNDLTTALGYLDLYTGLIQTNQNEELKRIISDIQQRHQVEKLEAGNREKQTQLERQWLIMAVMSLAILAILGFSIMIFINLRQKNRLMKQLREKNSIIEAQHRQITESIEYAGNIMRLSMGSSEITSPKINQGFVIYKPREVVGGDFYKIVESETSLLLAVADCTGHGVSGAFLASVYFHLLSKCTKDTEISLADVLKQFNTEHMTFFGKTGVDDISELQSCELSLLRVDTASHTVQFASINQRLLHIGKTGPAIMRGTHYSIGSLDNPAFEQTNITYHQGDIFCILSDGFTDQLNEAGTQKIGWKRLTDIIVQHQTKNLTDLKPVLTDFLIGWHGKRQQTDDITIIGIRL